MKFFQIPLFLMLCSQIIAGDKLQLNVQKFELPNGLKVLLYPNQQSPVIACRLFYTTGSVHERAGNSGIAHMLEHMLFKGTAKVGVTDSIADAKFISAIDQIIPQLYSAKRAGDSLQTRHFQAVYDSLLTEHRKIMIKDELWDTYLKNGGTGLNAFTSDLMTAYFVTLPKNKLELYLWLESDRMVNGVLREFYPERDVVREERRMRYDDSPYGRYWESLTGVFYEAHPYRVPTIGWPSDIANYTRQQAEEHYQKYYKPNNAILVLAGDFDPKVAMSMIRQYFEPLPKGESFAEVTIQEPEQVVEKRVIQRKNDAKPRMDILFHTPEFGNPDIWALDVIEGILNGRSGRLYNSLVLEQSLVHSASAGNSINKYTSSFEFSFGLKPEVDPQVVEKAFWKEIKKLQEELVTPIELEKVKNKVYATLVRSFSNLEHVANLLAFYEMYGNWQLLLEFPEQVSKVTPEQIQSVAKKYFQQHLSTVGQVLPLQPVGDQ